MLLLRNNADRTVCMYIYSGFGMNDCVIITDVPDMGNIIKTKKIPQMNNYNVATICKADTEIYDADKMEYYKSKEYSILMKIEGEIRIILHTEKEFKNRFLYLLNPMQQITITNDTEIEEIIDIC